MYYKDQNAIFRYLLMFFFLIKFSTFERRNVVTIIVSLFALVLFNEIARAYITKITTALIKKWKEKIKIKSFCIKIELSISPAANACWRHKFKYTSRQCIGAIIAKLKTASFVLIYSVIHSITNQKALQCIKQSRQWSFIL